jgi:hypothetical protein
MFQSLAAALIKKLFLQRDSIEYHLRVELKISCCCCLAVAGNF